jgi:hypothetical protein
VITISFIIEVPLRRHSGDELVEQLERGGAAGEVSGSAVDYAAEGATRG